MKVHGGGIVLHDAGYDQRDIHSVPRINEGLTHGVFCSEVLRCHGFVDDYLARVAKNDSWISARDHGQCENIGVRGVDPEELLLNVEEIALFIPDSTWITEPRHPGIVPDLGHHILQFHRPESWRAGIRLFSPIAKRMKRLADAIDLRSMRMHRIVSRFMDEVERYENKARQAHGEPNGVYD